MILRKFVSKQQTSSDKRGDITKEVIMDYVLKKPTFSQVSVVAICDAM